MFVVRQSRPLLDHRAPKMQHSNQYQRHCLLVLVLALPVFFTGVLLQNLTITSKTNMVLKINTTLLQKTRTNLI